MFLTIALAPELERRVRTEAVRRGISPDDYANQALTAYFAQADHETLLTPANWAQLTPEEDRARREGAIALLQSWIDEAEGIDLEEAAREEEEFLRNLRENRVSFR